VRDKPQTPFSYRMLSEAQERSLVRFLQDITERNTPLAEQLVAHYLANYPESVELRLAEIRLRFARHDFEGYRDLLLALKADPVASSALSQINFQLGLAYMRLGDDETALDVFRHSNRGRGGCESAHIVGCCLHRLGELEPAIQAFRESLATAPANTSVRVWSTVGLMLALRDIGREGHAEEVAAELHGAIAARPRFASSSIVYRGNQFDFHEWRQFRDKDLLHDAIAEFKAAKGPAAFGFEPETYVMPRDRQDLRRAASAPGAAPFWLAKPRNLSGAQGIAISSEPSEIDGVDDYIVQRYIENPLLVEGRKFHMRLYMFIGSVEPLRAYLWQDGLVKFAPVPYVLSSETVADSSRHLTNTERNREHPDTYVPDAGAPEDSGAVWSVRALLDRLRDQGRDVGRIRQLWQEMARGCPDVVAHSGLFAHQAAAAPSRAFGPKVLGLDVIMDDDLMPWLIEMQRAPGMASDVPMTETINSRLFRACAELTLRDTFGGPAEVDATPWIDAFDRL